MLEPITYRLESYLYGHLTRCSSKLHLNAIIEQYAGAMRKGMRTTQPTHDVIYTTIELHGLLIPEKEGNLILC